jgi:hypothetical protein
MSESDPLLEIINAYVGGDFELALRLAQNLDGTGIRHPILSVLLAQSAFRAHRPDLAQAALVQIEQFMQHDDAREILVNFTRDMIVPETASLFAAGDHSSVLGALDLARVILPDIAHAFPQGSAGLLAYQPKQRAVAPISSGLLMSFPGPKSRPVALGRRVLFLMRKFFLGPDSREHDMGPRMAAGFGFADWHCQVIDPTYDGRVFKNVGAGELFSRTEDHDAEIVIIDYCGLKLAPFALIEYINLCRRARPNMKIVLIHFDAWQRDTWSSTLDMGARADLVWSLFPDLDIWQQPAIHDKIFFAPFMVGVKLDEFEKPKRLPRIAFHGAVESYNASRSFWLTLLARSGYDIAIRRTGHDDDGLAPLESYRRYLAGFLSDAANLNFSARQDGSRIITGRTYETIFAGACLVQERSADIDYYFEAGKHYLSFDTYEDLIDILDWLKRAPDQARKIASAGQAFYRQHYRDEAIVAALDARLFGD